MHTFNSRMVMAALDVIVEGSEIITNNTVTTDLFDAKRHKCIWPTKNEAMFETGNQKGGISKSITKTKIPKKKECSMIGCRAEVEVPNLI